LDCLTVILGRLLYSNFLLGWGFFFLFFLLLAEEASKEGVERLLLS